MAHGACRMACMPAIMPGKMQARGRGRAGRAARGGLPRSIARRRALDRAARPAARESSGSTKLAAAMKMCALMTLPALAAAATAVGPCKTDLDCSLNGVCSAAGNCKCDRPWGGPGCGVLQYKLNQPLSAKVNRSQDISRVLKISQEFSRNLKMPHRISTLSTTRPVRSSRVSRQPAAVTVRAVTFSFLCPLLEKCGTFIARCNALIEKVSPCSAQHLERSDRWPGRGQVPHVQPAVQVPPAAAHGMLLRQSDSLAT
eukprot:SAG31_NODE_306_length_17979_cov_7.825447_11_plen_257_part_00